MVRALMMAGVLFTMSSVAVAQTSTGESVAIPELGVSTPATAQPARAMEWPELVMPSEPGPVVAGPHPVPIGFDLTYADRANATIVASAGGPAGPTDSSSVAWPTIASANGTVLMAVQSKYRVTDRCGNTLLEQNIADRVPTTGVLTAPSVIYDPWVDRWAMLWLETDLATQTSNYIVLVTTRPGNFDTATSVYYRVNAKTGTGADLAFADAPRLGYGPRGLSLASDQFRFTGFSYTGTQTITLPNAVFEAVGFAYRYDFFDASENLLGIYPVKMQGTQGNLDAIFVSTRRAGGNDLWMWRIYDAFGTRTGTPTTMPVPAYAMPPAVLQPDGRTFTRAVDCRLRSAVAAIDDGALKLHVVHNLARADVTQQAMIYAHRVVVSTAVVDESAFYVYGGNPELAMFAPTLAMSYDGTRAIAYTLSSPTTPPRAFVIISNPSLTLQQAQVGAAEGYRGATGFGYGPGLDFDWNDYFRYGPEGARRFVVLGQRSDADPLRTPTSFASVQNEPAGLVTYTGPSPIAFRKPPGAASFTPALHSMTIGNSFATEMGVRVEANFGTLDVTPGSFGIERLTGAQLVQVRPSALANALPAGRWLDSLRVSDCNGRLRFNIPVYFLVGCIADVDDGSGTGTPDGGVTIDDLLYFIARYAAGSIVADVDDGSGTGTPDGGVTIDDLLYYLERFDLGC